MPGQAPYALEPLAEGLWALIAPAPEPPFFCNSVFADMGGHALAVDSHIEPEGAETLLAEIAREIGKPVRRLVLTHRHPDHAAGRSAFPEDADIVAHEKVFERLAKGNGRPPNVLVRDFLELRGSERRVQLLHVGRGHTDADLCAWFPKERVLATGDLCFNGYQGWLAEGWTDEWIATLERLIGLKPALVVPGHGPAGGPELLETFRDYLIAFREAVGALLAEGVSPEEVPSRFELPPAHRGWGMGKYLGRNAARVAEELSGAAAVPGAPKET